MDVRMAYNALATQYDTCFKRPIDLAENDAIFNAAKLQGSILDLGCGTGLVPDCARINNYLGIDLSDEMLKVARKKHGDKEFMAWDMECLEELPQLKNRFDTVVSLFSFAYSARPGRTMRGIRYALKPGGRFFILTYGRRYKKRKSYIVNRNGLNVPALFYTASELENITGARVRGFHALAETLHIPSARYLEMEMATIGKIAPDLCLCLIAEGYK